MIAALNRPRLLVQAARFGAADYSRTVHLARILGHPAPPRPGTAILALLEREAEIEERRLAAAADYSVARHVELLIALMGEARFLRASAPRGPVAVT